MLEAREVSAGYRTREPVLRNVSLAVASATTVGLVGPSGCGKSTLARVLALLHPPSSGLVTVDGEVVRRWRHRARRDLRTRIGVVFQQPRLSVDPRLRLRDVIVEPLRACGRGGQAPARLQELVIGVALTEELLDRRAHEVSDGQLQRACVARALALRPRYLVCDEMTAMLDASTTAMLVRAVREYQQASGAGVLAVSHDRVLLDHWCDRVEELT